MKRGTKVVVSKEIAQLEHSSVKLTVTVGAADVRAQYDDLIASYAKNIQIPGFRKGKAPRDVLERKFGESLKGEALGRIMEKAVQEVFEAEDFALENRPLPYSTPAVQDEPVLDMTKDLTFAVTYDVLPKVRVGTWKGIEIEAPVADIGDEDLKRELDQIRDRNAIVMDKEEGAAAAAGDVATVDYAELDDSGEAVPGSQRQDFVFTIGSGQNLFKFDDDVVGMKAGSAKDVKKSYPADFQDADLAGKNLTIRIALKALKAKKLPDLDDDLAQDVSEKYKTLADLKADIKANLEKTAENRIRELKVNAFLEKVMADTAVDIPESMIRIEQESRWRALARRFNADSDQLLKILASSGRDYQSLIDEWRPDVERALKSRLIVETLMRDLAVEASDEELDAEMQTMADNMGISLDEVKKHYEQENMREYLREDIKERKLFDLVLAEAKLKKGKKRKYLDLMGNNG